MSPRRWSGIDILDSSLVRGVPSLISSGEAGSQGIPLSLGSCVSRHPSPGGHIRTRAEKYPPFPSSSSLRTMGFARLGPTGATVPVILCIFVVGSL